MTVNGIILAISWSAFSRIHDAILSAPGFSHFLREEKLLNGYFHYIDYVHVAQVVAVLVTGLTLFSVFFIGLEIVFLRVLLAASVGFTLYAIKTAISVVIVMHDLVWQKSIFEEDQLARQNSGKVVRFGNGEKG